MKKLLLLCSLSCLISLNAADANVWKGAPDALRKAAHNKEVRTALEGLGSDFANLMRIYMEQLKPRLTPSQKKELSSLLQRARLIIKKTRELAQKGGDDQRLQEEIQNIGQELVMAYFPLLLTIQQEVTDQEAAEIEDELRVFTTKGYDMLDNAVTAMIKVLK
jgi:hypothetical protein